MKILAVESSALTASVAVCEDERPIAEMTLQTGNTHSDTLLPMVEQLLAHAGLTVQDIDLFAVPIGPGSFTGIRIGVSLIKGLAFDSGKPCVGASSLEGMAYNLTGFRGILCPVMDARRNQLYNALFRFECDRLVRITEDRLIPATDLAAELSTYDEPVILTGEGSGILQKASPDAITYIIPSPLMATPNAVGVAQLALQMYRSGQAVSDDQLLPVYLRPSQAERERNERLAEEKSAQS
ncbi:MAG: tRNA (adenosine(37)-N6)-threonylcarbamoyltransferase complex dimerization subunit type 1 TsaB [Clostridia bacterium]|nr:tRNA (adenosine(37)-N6)-threonylcarbamoyltransferase complex dimerization subunit type 1 TsaB [Clostridia bacterium]